MKNYNMNNLTGIDACLETSLFEYGFAYIESNCGDKILFYYGINIFDDNEYNESLWNRFDFCEFDKNLDVYEEFSWISDWNELFDFIDMTNEEWYKLPLETKIYDLLNYYGYMDIFGGSYHHRLIYNPNINRFQSPKE